MSDIENKLPVTKPNLLTPIYSDFLEEVRNAYMGREIINPAFLMGNTLDGVAEDEPTAIPLTRKDHEESRKEREQALIEQMKKKE